MCLQEAATRLIWLKLHLQKQYYGQDSALLLQSRDRHHHEAEVQRLLLPNNLKRLLDLPAPQCLASAASFRWSSPLMHHLYHLISYSVPLGGLKSSFGSERLLVKMINASGGCPLFTQKCDQDGEKMINAPGGARTHDFQLIRLTL